jgi:hypothetical protein
MKPTCAPSLAKAVAIARPMPALAPVITTTLFPKVLPAAMEMILIRNFIAVFSGMHRL